MLDSWSRGRFAFGEVTPSKNFADVLLLVHGNAFWNFLVLSSKERVGESNVFDAEVLVELCEKSCFLFDAVADKNSVIDVNTNQQRAAGFLLDEYARIHSGLAVPLLCHHA